MVIFLALSSCGGEQAVHSLSNWEPNPLERFGAERIAVGYAESHLGVDREVIVRMRTETLAMQRNGVRVLTIRFFDPQKYPVPESGVTLGGADGWPYRFTVTVGVETGQVVHHTASAVGGGAPTRFRSTRE
jgi:hypothetical protein